MTGATYHCPYCRSGEAQGQARCRECGGDLRLLVRLHSEPDVWFNRALRAIEGGDLETAAEFLSACCAARPEDAEARFTLSRVWALLGRWSAAHRSALLARDLSPAPDGLAEWIARTGSGAQGQSPAGGAAESQRREED